MRGQFWMRRRILGNRLERKTDWEDEMRGIGERKNGGNIGWDDWEDWSD